ncbi:SGNH/GDSL hydrolase family protein [Pseudomonas sp. PhalM4]
MIRRACFATLLILTASTAIGSSRYDHIYAFGDSYSDNGAGEILTKALVEKKVADAQEVPGTLYWQGRWSNGPTAVEHLAQALKVPLTDYAIGGAKSGSGNYYSWMMPHRDTGVFGQITEHLAEQTNTADPKSLYFIFVSANDFFEWADFSHPESIDTLSRNSVANIQKAVEKLIAAGAKNMMVVGSTDLSRVPAVVQGNQVSNAAKYQQVLESKLPVMLSKLSKTHHVSISYFDHIAFSDNLRKTASSAGLTELNKPCQPTYPEVKPACQNPDAYYYWDEWHPTRQVHSLAAKAMLDNLSAKD